MPRGNETISIQTPLAADLPPHCGIFLVVAAVLLPFAARAEKANVFFIHGANVSEHDARAWAAEMFKRLGQAVLIP